MPTRWTGTEPVSEFDDGVPDSPTPIPRSTYGSAICQYELCSFQSRSISRNASGRNACPLRSVRREPCRPTRLADRGATRRDEHHGDACGDDRGACLDRRVAEHVLQVLLAEVGGAHQRAEDDDPRAGGDPERRTGCDLQVVEGVRCATLPDDEEDGRDGCDREQREGERLLVRDWEEVDCDD